MDKIHFTSDEKALLVTKLKTYFRDQLEQEIGGFDAEFLIDFFTEELGTYFYNRGLYDALALMSRKLEDIGDALMELEKPTDFRR